MRRNASGPGRRRGMAPGVAERAEGGHREASRRRRSAPRRARRSGRTTPMSGRRSSRRIERSPVSAATAASSGGGWTSATAAAISSSDCGDRRGARGADACGAESHMRPPLRSGPPIRTAAPSARSIVVNDDTSARVKLRDRPRRVAEREQRGEGPACPARRVPSSAAGLVADRHGGEDTAEAFLACREQHAPRERIDRRRARRTCTGRGRGRPRPARRGRRGGRGARAPGRVCSAKPSGSAPAAMSGARGDRVGLGVAIGEGRPRREPRRRAGRGTRTNPRGRRPGGGGGSTGPAPPRPASPDGCHRSARSGRGRAPGRASRRPPVRR